MYITFIIIFVNHNIKKKTGTYKHVVVVGSEVGSAFGLVNKNDKLF